MAILYGFEVFHPRCLITLIKNLAAISNEPIKVQLYYIDCNVKV